MRVFAFGLSLLLLTNQFSVVASTPSSSSSSETKSSQSHSRLSVAAMRRKMPHYIRPAVASSSLTLNVSRSRLAPMRARLGVRELVHYPSGPPLHPTRDPLAIATARLSSTETDNVAKPSILKKSGSAQTLPNVAASDTGTGINRWWTYQERPIPGIGKAMLNVGTGNLIIQATDVDVPARGLDLVMQRTYNSQSLHDSLGTDGSEPSIFGNGWTNTYDAYMVVRNNGATISVYDIDGTRCDYAAQTDGSWKACKGEHAQLEVDPNSAGCSYWWIKKSGTTYWFHSPFQSCINQPATVGRVYAIYGRNSNNNVTLNYSFVQGQPQTTENITEIDVNHSNGQTLTMLFELVGGTYNELATLTRPDGQQITYSYDVDGDLAEVDRPGNDTTAVLPETYGNQRPIQFACGPRATISLENNNGTGNDGSCLHFDYDTSVTPNLIDWKVNGVLNFDPGDGFGMLQPGQPTGWQTFYVANFVYTAGSGTPCGTTVSSTTTMCDSDGHSTVWTLNTRFEATQTQVATGGSSSLVTTQSWDDKNNLTSTTDPRGNEIDYGYDSNGNAVMVRQPSIQSSQGQLRPMSLYSYDAFNNIVAYCDPVSNVGKPPPTQMTDSLCPTTVGSGNAVYQYTYPSYEPFGELTAIYSACYNASCQDQGNYTQVLYDPSFQGGTADFGLPTSVIGKSYSQQDSTTRYPEQDFTYNGKGNLLKYTTGQHPVRGGAGTWILTYDVNGMNRVVTRQDPDGYTSHMCYNLDGSTWYTETPYQYSLDLGGNCAGQGATPPPMAVAFTHDTDGNVLTELHHHGGQYQASFSNPTAPPDLSHTASTIHKYYDGEDRLVEVQQPLDPNTDIFSNSWITRYFYDITQGNGSANLTFQGKTGTFAGYGNLYKTVELLPSQTNDYLTWGPSPQQIFNSTPAPPTPIPNTAFADLNATAYDATDRPVSKYRIVYSNSAEQLATELLQYDANSSTLGLLYSDCQNEVSECKLFSYDKIGHKISDSFTKSGQSDPNTLTRTTTYDPDGRVQQVAQSGASGDSDSYTYDLDGRLLKVGKQSGANITYDYYLDGKRKSLGGTLQGTVSNDTFDYSYAPDGTIQQLTYNFQKNNQLAYWGREVYSLSLAGRVTERDDYSNNYGPMSTYKSYANALLTEVDFPCNNCNGNPVGSHASMMYSAEGELLGQLVTAPWSFTVPGLHLGSKYAQTWYYNKRGEVITTYDHNHNQTNTRYANGVQIAAYPVATPSSTLNVVQASWDGRMGATVASAYGAQMTNSITGLTTMNGETSGVQYDRAGRNTSSAYSGFCYANPPGGCTTPLITQSATRSYDIENHVIGSVGSYYPSTTMTSTYTWGSNGHPRLVGSTSGSNTGTDATFWDGDSLLYSVTNGGNGAVDDIKIGADADYTPSDNGYSGVTFYDRGADGSIAFCHNASGGSGGLGDGDASITHNRFWSGGPSNPCGPTTIPSWGMQYPINVAWNGSYQGSTAGVGAGWTIGELRSDGINDGVNTIQGVRVYDPTAGQWTTPDAYSGVVRDPMTQKGYMWNGNNSVAYSDPTGFDQLLEVQPNAVGHLGHIQMIVYDPVTLSGWLLSVQSANGNAFGPLKVIETPIADIRTLPDNKDHKYYYMKTNPQQDQAAIEAYNRQMTASSSGAQYNIYTNDCVTSAQQALDHEGVNLVLYPVPTLNQLYLPVEGAPQVHPSQIQAQSSGPVASDITDPYNGLSLYFETNAAEAQQFMNAGQDFLY